MFDIVTWRYFKIFVEKLKAWTYFVENFLKYMENVYYKKCVFNSIFQEYYYLYSLDALASPLRNSPLGSLLQVLHDQCELNTMTIGMWMPSSPVWICGWLGLQFYVIHRPVMWMLKQCMHLLLLSKHTQEKKILLFLYLLFLFFFFFG